MVFNYYFSRCYAVIKVHGRSALLFIFLGHLVFAGKISRTQKCVTVRLVGFTGAK